MTVVVPGQHCIRIKSVAASRGSGHFPIQPASKRGDAAIRHEPVTRCGGAIAKACVANLDVLIAALDGQGAPTVSLRLFEYKLYGKWRRLLEDSVSVD